MIYSAERHDLTAILEIYNEAILNTTAVYDYKPHSIEDRTIWYDKKMAEGFPILVYKEDNAVAGFATYGPFRAWPAYKYTIEHSVYVHKDFRGKHIGTALLKALIEIANAKGYAIMVAGIDASNESSKILHKKLGFSESGTIYKAGYKFGTWLDLVFYQYQLQGPDNPKDE
ncbi:GNAT family N-acetyltransferase [Sporomusa acidovorans]|uniref:L-methionine sulfoximine/L-methionine sulfone acetyltransferase n=1 Tax=Sporomusa acidovorans (strain ATCC 49682 / DSM 3132 / Mol) TaxID=1123286 RepID=A0ABZ3J4H3_SPOA4|nr:GNAT family N-acetyltransferase [Sporomusa acidovorans]OZC20949.1 N-acyltransferase YncA [Sporomusa acidovorans DSM 3132]SDE62068.1 phosphinothricin acetyltransferase [Sporomusa acidovorans]